LTYVTRLRAAVGARKVPIVYASAIVRDEAGRILFQRRSDFGEAWWGLPGGVLEPDEEIADCCRREVLEETGLVIEPARLAGVYSSPRYDVLYPNGDEAQQVTAAFECRVAGGELKVQPGEIVALQFCPTDALPHQPLWYGDMVRDCLAGAAAAHFDPPEFRDAAGPDAAFQALRAGFGQRPFVAPGAAAFICDEGGRVLLQRREDDGQWGLPAGALELGESLAATAIRETREETGLQVKPIRLIGVYSGYEIEYPNGDRLQPFANVFECRLLGGDLRADGHESLEARFFAPDALPPVDERLAVRLADAFARREAAFFR
jgi:8-oxo-dGTP diphosphatase